MHPLFHPLFVEYCAYFNDHQDYFECHEVLEDYWKTCAPRDRLHPLVGYVQLATGMYHYRRGNTVGALRILAKAKKNLQQHTQSPFVEYIDLHDLLVKIDGAIEAMLAGEAFRPFQLLLTNEKLQQLAFEKAVSLPAQVEHYVLHKHMLRDRSDIVALREEKLRQK